jgi:hypothetical protein
MSKLKMKELCGNCKENKNGWCKDLETNDIDTKIANCTGFKNPIVTEDNSIKELADKLLSNDYFVYRLIEELKKKGELR